MFEVAGTHFERGVFDIYLEKKVPGPLKYVLALGAVQARLIGIGMLAFSFFFSTSKAPMTLFMEQGWAANPEVALNIQRNISYVFYFLALVFYMTVFLFRKETIEISFNKASRLILVIRESGFRFWPPQRGHITFADVQAVEKVPSTQAPEAPYGKLIIKSAKLPKGLQQLEFRVLSDEQFEYFPMNIERILGN